MKFLKISVAFLVLAAIANIAIVEAMNAKIASPVGVAIQKTLTKNQTEHIGTTYQMKAIKHIRIQRHIHHLLIPVQNVKLK